MSEERDIYISRALQLLGPVQERREGQIVLNLHFFRQSRFWLDHPANYTRDEYSLVAQRSFWVYTDYLTSTEIRWMLFALGVPLAVQPPILEKIAQLAQVADPDRPVTVVIYHILIGSLGSVAYQDVVDFLAREHFDLSYSPTAAPPAAPPAAPAFEDLYPTWRFSSIGMYSSFPATKSFIEGLKKVRFDSLEQDVTRESPACAVCIRDFVESVDKLVTSLPCSHLYHVDCIVQWLERDSTCPLCRYQMPEASLADVINLLEREGRGDER